MGVDEKHMDIYEKQLEKEIPEFEEHPVEKHGEFDISATVSAVKIHGWKQVLGILAVAIVIIGGWELLIRVYEVPEFVFPAPSAGYTMGVSIGLALAVVLTQIPYLEKVITPYILLLITTPMLALVPLLMLKLGFNVWPRIIAVTLASGPMVMINSVTGFRRTDLAKIALAKSYGATTLQIFKNIRFPLALPMIIVGLLVGGIFGLITAVGSDMVGGRMGLGFRLSYYSSLARTAHFFAVIILVSAIGISIWIIFSLIGKKYASWQE